MNFTFNGEGLLTLCISDGEYEVCASAVVIIQPVNDAPVFVSTLEVELGLDVDFNIPIEVFDVDSEELEVLLSSNFEYPEWFIENFQISGTPTYLGSFELPLLLSDGELVTEDTLLVSVHNFIPEITMITDVPDDQGGRVYLSFNASYFDTDANSDQLYSVFRYDMIEED